MFLKYVRSDVRHMSCRLLIGEGDNRCQRHGGYHQLSMNWVLAFCLDPFFAKAQTPLIRFVVTHQTATGVLGMRHCSRLSRRTGSQCNWHNTCVI